jgi:transcriptional regulator with XRE-family HTH domain
MQTDNCSQPHYLRQPLRRKGQRRRSHRIKPFPESVLGIPVRESLPPFFLVRIEGQVVPNYSGDFWHTLQGQNAPSIEELRLTLISLRRHLHWGRPMLSAFLGVSRDTLRRWETGERTPTGAARRLIFLAGMLVLTPDKLRNGLDIMFWGQCEHLRQAHKDLMALWKRAQSEPPPSEEPTLTSAAQMANFPLVE